MGAKAGGILAVRTFRTIYSNAKVYFTKLLEKDFPDENKEKIKRLLNKPWNPYVFSARILM
jgi:hypothetical protein